jgi:hypothetical protein
MLGASRTGIAYQELKITRRERSPVVSGEKLLKMHARMSQSCGEQLFGDVMRRSDI